MAGIIGSLIVLLVFVIVGYVMYRFYIKYFATTNSSSSAVNVAPTEGSTNGSWIKVFPATYSDSANLNSNGLATQAAAQQLAGAWSVSYSDPQLGGNGLWYAQSSAPKSFNSGNGSYYSKYAALTTNTTIGWSNGKNIVAGFGNLTLKSNALKSYTLTGEPSTWPSQIVLLGTGAWVINNTSSKITFYDKI